MLNPERVASVPGRFHVAEANFWPETLAAQSFPAEVRILDSTLRKTYFTAGQATTDTGFVRIAEALVETGVTDTCLNVTWAGATEPTPQDWRLMRTVLDADLPWRVNVWSDVLLGNGRDPLPIDPAVGLRLLTDAGATHIAPGIVPAPDADAAARQMDQLDAHLALARELGVTTTITLAQVALRDFAELVRVSRHAVRGGAVRLDLMDSTSALSPQAMRSFVRRFRREVGEHVDVTMHVHDEFGLATAGTLAAVSEGAMPDVSVNGMSYRAGFAPLEEVVLALEVLHGVDTGLRLDRLAELSRIVAEESGLPIPQLKPLTGSYAHLKHMPGDATAAIERGDDAFPPISHGLVPPVMGAHVSWVWGRASSRAQTAALAASVGEELTEEELTAVRAALDATVEALQGYPRWLSPTDARAVLLRTLSGLRAGLAVPSIADAVAASVPDPTLADDIARRLGDSVHAAVPAADSVAEAVGAAVDALSPGQLVDILQGFRRFGDEEGGARPELSAAEERGIAAAADVERARLLAASTDYERRFGFRAVVAADGRSAADVADEIVSALGSDAEPERRRVRVAVATILSGRIDRRALARSDASGVGR